MPKRSETLDKLNQAITLLKQANNILDVVQAGWSVPDAPELPSVTEALTNIQAQGQHTVDIANRLLATLPPR